MAFKLNGWSAFTSKEERKIRKAKKKIFKAGKGGPEGNDLFSADKERKINAAIKKLRKAGWSDEKIEEATGSEGWAKAIEWAADPAVTKKDIKRAKQEKK